MKKISLRLSDSEYSNLEMFRGNRSISDYVRLLLSEQGESVNNENADFHKLFSDMSIIREALPVLATKKDLLELAAFVAEVSSFANTVAYANHREQIQNLLQSLTSIMNAEG